MKDIIITANAQRNEVMIIVICLLCAVGVNIYSIITFDRPWIELFSQIGWTVIIAAVFYALTVFVRVVLYILKRILARKR
ncbi:MAG: hypothetical protein R3Y39_03180 [Rikenellaceae bacterium]